MGLTGLELTVVGFWASHGTSVTPHWSSSLSCSLSRAGLKPATVEPPSL